MPEPGWYADPTDPARLRMWDGQRWTGQALPASDLALGSPTYPHKEGKRWIAAAVVAVVVLAGGAMAYLVGTTSNTTPSDTTPAILLEPAASPGPNPFMASIAGNELPAAETGVDGVADRDQLQKLPGDTAGLFAGSRDTAICDIDQLVSFLSSDDDKAQAFASALGISTGDIASWARSLAPVVVREDTRVTNHGFVEGAASPFQSVLQSGTAVLVNDRGLPVVRCECGNPLAPPAEDVPRVYDDDPERVWPSFSPNRLVTVSGSASPLTTIDVIDPETGTTTPQPMGSGGLILAPDGLGIVTVGDRTADVVETLTDLLGPPTFTGAETSVEGGLFRTTSWRSLSLTFQVPDSRKGERNSPNKFVSYRFGPWSLNEDGTPARGVEDRGDDGSWEPAAWERALATPEGITINTDGKTANAAYPKTFVLRDYLPTDRESGLNSPCAMAVPNKGLKASPSVPINEQVIALDQTRQGQFFAPLDNGRVRGIGGGSVCGF